MGFKDYKLRAHTRGPQDLLWILTRSRGGRDWVGAQEPKWKFPKMGPPKWSPIMYYDPYHKDFQKGPLMFVNSQIKLHKSETACLVCIPVLVD